MRWIECYRCVFDGVMVLWFFRPLAARWGEPGRKRALLGALLLLCALPIYIVPGVNSVWDVLVRFGGRALIYYAWLRVYKGTGVRESLYFALLCWFAFTTENNIFLTPQLTFLRWNMVEFTSAAWLNSVISKVIELLLEVALVTIISRAFPFQDERPIDWQRLGFLGAVVICQLYIKHTLKVISAAAAPLESYGREITSYPILLQLWLAASVLLLERYLASRARAERARLAETAEWYRYESQRSKAQASADLRQLHHDMKNHLLGIQELCGDNEKLKQYLGQLLDRTRSYETQVHSGNPMLDGLLTEKIRWAESQGIEVNACLDFRPGAFLSDMDVCTIFGNAMDNAIEASLQVVERERRSILVKCACSGGCLVLTFSNYYEGELRWRGETLLSRKTGGMHGIGLSSIRNAAEKYGGTIAAGTDDFHNFTLTVMLPLPDGQGEP